MWALTYALSLAEEDRAEFTFLHAIESRPVSEPVLLEWKQQDREKLSQMAPTPDVDLAYKPEIEVEVGIPEVEDRPAGGNQKSGTPRHGLSLGGCRVDALAVDDSSSRVGARALPGAHRPRRMVRGEEYRRRPEQWSLVRRIDHRTRSGTKGNGLCSSTSTQSS